MLSVGRVLRQEREKQQLSLEELAGLTRISSSYLLAIEADEINRISTAFYYRSFVKQLAAALKLDYSTLEEAVNDACATIPEARLPGQESHSLGLPPIRQRQSSPLRWASSFLSLVTALLVCSGLYALLDRAQFWDLSPAEHFAHRTTEQAQALVSSLATPAPTVKPAQPQALDRSTRADSRGDAITLKIAAVEKAWLSIDTDGRNIYSGLLEAADTKELEGRDSARIRTGNAGGLTVTFNGRQLGVLGDRGQVRTVLFTRDQYEILQPSLTTRLQLLPAATLGQWAR
jgi:transcriptional regulator with XRE-family HTH domain